MPPSIFFLSLHPPFFCVWVPARPLHLSLKLILLFCVFWQATIAERANVFRHQCELAETMKLKEINLYVLVAPFLLITLFYLWFRWYHVKSSRTLQDTEPWLFSWFLLLYSDRSLVVMTWLHATWIKFVNTSVIQQRSTVESVWLGSMLISISHHISIGNKAEFRLCDKDSAF